MKNILAIGASNSSKSINKVLATYIANEVIDGEVTALDWNEMELPLYGSDLEEASGIPENAHKFLKMIADADAVVLSLAEHNGLPSAAFKNLWDWTSRIEQKFWANKPMILAATSPGGRGGIGVLATIKNMISHFGGNVIADFSLPSFYDNFKDGKMNNEEIAADLNQKVQLFQKSI
jgi:NAD(P)H-dependent FMN reductase